MYEQLPTSKINLDPKSVKPFVLPPLNLSESPAHPGDLLKLLLDINDISQESFSKKINIPFRTVNDLCNRQFDLTESIALRIGKAFNMDHIYWLDLQRDYNIYKSRVYFLGDLNEIETYYTLKDI